MVLGPLIARVNTLVYGQAMTKRLNRDAWVRAGLAALSEGGVDAVSVDQLARRLGITRGSFYWHFESRDALLLALLAQWEHVQTEAVIAATEASGGPAHQRMETLSANVAGLDMKLETAVRRWSTYDRRAEDAVSRIDQARLAYLKAIIHSAGVPEDHARARARLIYFALIGEITSNASATLGDRAADTVLNRDMILRWP